jgi:hypothetical protein
MAGECCGIAPVHRLRKTRGNEPHSLLFGCGIEMLKLR